MSDFKNGRYASSAATRKAALDRLDDLVSRPWYTNSKEPEEAARVKHHVQILKVTSELDAAELLGISHSCNTCKPDTCPDGTQLTRAADLAEALIDDTKDKLKRMKVIATRINNRNCQIQKLEHHLKTFGTVLESVKVVLPGNGIEYSYRIDPQNGISLVIQGPNNSDTQDQKGATPTDLLDSDAPGSFEAPVLKATRTPPLTPTPAPAPAPVATLAKNHTEIEKKAVTSTTETGLKIPNLQIWDSEQDRAAALRAHAFGSRGRIDPDGSNTPLIFTKGICGRTSPHEDPTAQSRMVVFSGLHPKTTYPELLDKVRGA
ncbi:hypothetical protein CHU98_g9749, partial [Xylaria longipes]